MRCVTRGLAASAAAVAPASTERPSMGVYELARAAASRCAARIEEFPVFRLAWSERGAPRVILPVFRLAWSERGAPRRGLARRGEPGCAWCVYEAAACGLPTRLARRVNGPETAAPRRGTCARCACPERANAMLGAGCRSCFTQSCSDRAARSAGKAFVQTPQDSLGWVGGLRMSTVPRRAGGTPFFRHVHLKAGIEVPRARLSYRSA